MRGRKIAVLICGDVATHWGYDEFWNDVVLMREVLLQNGFCPEHIHVLYGDGVDFSHASRTNPRYIPAQPITDFAATSTNVQLVFDGLANGDQDNNIEQMTADDFLFVWTFDHGDTNGTNSLLGLRDNDMLDTTFAGLIDQIPCSYRVICMQQCYSGGFVDDLANDRTVILTAASGAQLAWRADDSPGTENEVFSGTTYHHGEFNFHLFSALSRERIDYTNVAADANLDRFVSMREVFDYIVANDSSGETPQYNDGANTIGQWLTIERDVFLYIRDNDLDLGQVPSTGAFWDSPDLWVRNSDDDGTAHQNPKAGQTNWIYARVHNAGLVRSGPVSVKLFCAGFTGTEFVFPDDYTDLITWATVDSIPAGGEAVVKGPWIPSELAAAPGHPCLLAEVYDHSGIPPVGSHAWDSNHLAQKNLTIVSALAGQSLLVGLMVGHVNVIDTKPKLRVRVVSGPPGLKATLEIRDKGWIDLLRESRLATLLPSSRLAIRAVGNSRLRIDVPTGYGEETAGGLLLDLTEGSEIRLDDTVSTPALAQASAYSNFGQSTVLDAGGVLEQLLPPLIRKRRQLYLRLTLPASVPIRSYWIVDVERCDGTSDQVLGGVRFRVQVSMRS